MSFQTRKTFVHLRSTNVFDAFWELSDPPIDSRDPATIKVEVCAGLFFKSRSRKVLSRTHPIPLYSIFSLCSPAVRFE